MAKSVVIVESPAKSKTINKILGKSFHVTSSMGHLIDLPKNKMGIDVDHDFKPEYIVIPDRRKYLAKLKKEIKKAENIYLAPDPDREGEAISWHLQRELGKKKKVYRVTFDEITEKAVKAAFAHPRDIDMNLVKAQQTRRILDRIVGYSISPILWKKVTRGLSAGRVQSVAVRLIVERENEIRSFKPAEYWQIEAILKKKIEGNENPFSARLDKCDGKKFEFSSKKQSDDIVEILQKSEFVVKDVKHSKRKKRPQAPFTTSTLQQESFNKLRYPVNRTMRVAQSLYEGLEIGGEGSIGLITYMRTDSVKISDDGRNDAKKYIIDSYGKKYYPETPNVYKSRKQAQEAHEAVRPTLPLRSPESIQKYLKSDQYKVYQLIWNRFMASQMENALYSQVSASIIADKYSFKVSGSNLLFDGFMALYADEEKDSASKANIPELKKNEPLDLLKLIPSQHFTKPPAHYSDASLVKVLEEKGIGRPSTYAPILYTIIARNYVKRVSGYLWPTELGEIVNKLLVENFPDIMDVKFTAGLEEKLDEIEQGKTDRYSVLSKFYKPFSKTLSKASENMKNIKREGVKTDEFCPDCKRPIVIKWGRRGKFLSCSGFPKCKFAKSITSGVKCPNEGCDGELIERSSRRGSFYGCTKYPKCTYTSRTLPKETEEPKKT